jgi:malate permease and related proteins
MLCVMFMNAGNYGLPVSQFAFGREGFDRGVLYFVVQAILAPTLAIYIAGAGQSRFQLSDAFTLEWIPDAFPLL